ncbi:hypothetical protein BST27_26615 [Mycobacterium intermedium]|uniref:Uncharacterized protein n=1 Tax=Mycobacterium intermedium TaxID=28445 RepID=A0A1E3SJP5_MYCIE|nr:hypothetical protein [Mycobacterium intermedium]MCV6962607.1 hypothetical protein [Mycobacterium intermedium]ODR02374.1 hypothetical protein BHQ20_04615 [Mycobacterium intermedium]OPE48257.1 hypothetical protein BV508_18740 [Mycobacterium intermedium]ORA95661.1 hypothetical protein BST27_26615 [Mycobacterium intermedium]
MSADPQVAPAVTVGQPRRAVIDRAWRAIGPGVEVLSSDDGGPLSRTVKRIIDPLVLRLRSNPQYSAPMVSAETAAAMHDLIVENGPQLRFAAAWFGVLKLERRRQRIRSGNAQELYFPVCFELAVTKGAPTPQDRESAAETLHAIHQGRDRTAIEVLNEYVANREVVASLAAQLERSWRDVRADGDTTVEVFLAELGTVLGQASGHNAAAARQRVWRAMIDDPTPYNLGARTRVEGAELPWSIVELGLSSVAPQRPPAISGGSDSDRPLDRSVVDRVRSTLRRALDRDALPDIPMLCAEEVDRASAPWGLLSEDKQATMVAGIEVAGELAPLDRTVTSRYALAAQIQARLRKEAYVLHARRYLAAGGPIHPRQRQVVDDLASYAQPYLSRLWARLHGRDVWQEPCDDVDDVRSLLEGVARSVSLDHRQRIKSMLELQVAG